MDVERTQRGQVDAKQREGDHQRYQHRSPQVDEPGDVGNQRQIQRQQHQIADVHGDDDAPEHGRFGIQEMRPRLNAVAQHHAQQHGRGAGTRNAKRQERHEGTAAGGVVGGFRRGDAPGAVRLVVALEALLQIEGEKARQRGAGTRQHADEKAEYRTAPHCWGHRFGVARVQAGVGDVGRWRGVLPRHHHAERFRQRKRRHRHEDETQPVRQFKAAEGKALHTSGLIRTNGAEHQADESGRQRAQDLPALREGGDAGEREDEHQGVLGRLKLRCQTCQRRSEQQKRDGAERATGERCIGGQRQRPSGLSAPRHGIAFERGRHRRRHPRRIDENRRRGAAEYRAVVDPGHHDEASGGFKRIAHWNHQGDGGDWPQARHHADQGAGETARGHPRQIARIERRRQAR